MKRAENDDEHVHVLPPKKRGRPVLIGEELDRKLQQYLTKVREGNGVVSARIAVASARGIMLHCNRSSPVEFGGHVQLNRHWAYSLLKRMKFVKRIVNGFVKAGITGALDGKRAGEAEEEDLECETESDFDERESDLDEIDSDYNN